MKGDSLLKFESVQNWLNSLDQVPRNRKKGGLTKNAKAMRLGRMWEYTNEGKLSPDELLQEAKEDIDKAGQRLNNYFDEKLLKVSNNSAITFLCYLRGFYTHNNLTFPKKWGVPKSDVSKVTQRDKKTSFYKYNSEKDKIEFKNGNLQHFIQNLNFRDQVIALCLLSTGADATDLFNLKVGFVKDGRGKITEDKRLFWHSNRAKTGIPFKTFFSEEATKFLKRYVEQERANASDDEPLFVQSGRTYTRKNPITKELETITENEKFNAHALSINFREASQKMGYTKQNEASPFRPKRFRHLFRTACAITQIDNGLTMAFMGHTGDTSSSYLEQDSSIFEKMYVKIEPLLTVFGVNQNVVNEMTKEVSGLKTEVAILVKGGESITNRTTELEDEVKDLKEQLKSAVEMVYSFEPILNTFNEIANTTEGQALINKIHEAKAKQEMEEAQNETDKLRAEITKENHIQDKVKRE